MSKNDTSPNSADQFQDRLSSEAANALLHQSVDAILIGDIETHVLLWANPAGCRMLGRTLDEVRGLPLTEIHPKESLAEVMASFDAQARGEFTLAKEIPVVDRAGNISYHDIQSVQVTIDDRSYLMGCFRDIGERRAGEDRFRLAIQELPMGLHLWSLDPDNQLIFTGANHAADSILGITNADSFGLPILEAFPALTGTPIPDTYRRLATEGGVWREEQVNYEDERIKGAFEVVAFQIKAGEVGAMFWDITERIKAENEMRRLMAALAAMGESVIITDSHGTIQYANPFFLKLTGYSLDDLIGQNARILKSGEHDTAFYAKLWQVLTSGEIWTGNLINRKKDGSVYHEQATIAPVRNPAGEIVSYVAVKRDMTHEIDLERRVMRSQKMASLGQFAHRVAHDVTNCLTSILGNAHLLQGSDLAEDQRGFAKAIAMEVDRISKLTTDLMAFAHPGEMHTVKCKLDRVISNISEMIDRACKPYISVTYHLANKLSADIDENQISQALMHLVVNSTEAVDKEGSLQISLTQGTMPARIALNSETAEGDVPAAIILVKDTGVGLTQEECEHAFEPFFSTKRDVRRNAGLGLATVYAIIARHNGDITIASHKDEGTEVRISLPLAD